MDKLPKPFFVLAPMDDVTDTVFRQIIAELAPPDLYFTEFVNVDGLQSPGREKLTHKLQFSDKEHPIIAQLWGLKPDNYFKTTKELIKMGYDGVDINMGCPVKTVVKNGACAALINNRGLAGEIIDAVGEAAGDHFPVSVKTRVGFSSVDMSWIDFLLNKKILNMLSIHGRTARELSKVPANWHLIGHAREMRDSLSPQTKIIGNGDITTRVQGERLAKKYNLDGIMAGRGIFHDPLLFSKSSAWSQWGKKERIGLYRRHIELFDKTWQKGERRIETLNKFCKVYVNGFGGAKELREELMAQHSAGGLLEVLDRA